MTTATSDDLEGFPKEFDSAVVEARCQELWEAKKIYRFDPAATGPIFSVDTPPPYVSASHLHVGHAMSYTQAEIVVRFQRMNGKRIFYPMGFDDNGLPTERYVEKEHKIDKRRISRTDFRSLCLEVTAAGAKEYELLWRALGLSVDWTLRYSTIDEHCRRTAQKSFIELYKNGRIYRSSEPVLWDCSLETALAQADLDTMERKGTLHDIAFAAQDGAELVISTTRPELLPGCVALYHHPTDQRYAYLAGTRATVPLFEHSVPILTDEDVDPAYGTGLMMVCTFGDGEDVRRWKRDGLETRICIAPNGRLTELAGEFQGLTIELARKAVVAKLQGTPSYKSSKPVEQKVSISERTGVPVEFVMAPQWFIRVLDMKEKLLARSAELRWSPDWMKVRLEQWISGLRFDWNITRQRFYGVPVPVWYCDKCGAVSLPPEEALPVDPLEDVAPSRCAACGANDLTGDPDVMDTWMTSSLSPLINSNWANTPNRPTTNDIYPMSVRVQAFEIIRTWLFYTLVKSELHTDSLPWSDVMISGWGLNESGKKISKRDLDQFTDATGFNRYEPYGVVRKYGADALRYWASGGHLGHDMRYNERDVANGRKLVIKLWNAARFCALQMKGHDPSKDTVQFAQRTPEDRWIIGRLMEILLNVRQSFENYDYARAREHIDGFFWKDFCDYYLELVKDRFWRVERYPEEARKSSRSTLRECVRVVLALYAPFTPFVTEELYQILYAAEEGAVSLHVTAWPEYRQELHVTVPEVGLVLDILRAVRAMRTNQKISQTRELARLTIDATRAGESTKQALAELQHSLQAAARAREVEFGSAAHPTDVPGVNIDITAQA